MKIQNSNQRSLPARRFGRTGLQVPVLSLGGMRYQQSWQDISARDITLTNQKQLEDIVYRAVSDGLTHIETARHYGSSERQLGWALNNIDVQRCLLQTKIAPNEDSRKFEDELELSFERLNFNRLDLLAIHGINTLEHLEQTIAPGGCLDVVRRWQDNGRIGSVGFSTHAPTDLIVKTIETNEFDYVNLHWYFIRQDNEPALEAADRFDLGVFVISPTDKGGHLHTPSKRLIDLCSPLHPIVFNDLFCLSDPRVHTISVGAAKTEDLDLHLEAVALLDSANQYLPEIKTRLHSAAVEALGEDWLISWHMGLPRWNETPGNINIPILLWLHNLVEAWGMEGYAKARYSLLGNASHWFPGENADCLDSSVSEDSLKLVLVHSPWCQKIPCILRQLRDRFRGNPNYRLSQ